MGFSKLLASVGIGNAKVDTIIHTPALVPGEDLIGVIKVFGGNVDQVIDKIDLSLYTIAQKESEEGDSYHEAEILRTQICEPFTIRKDEQKDIPLNITAPIDMPLTQVHGFDLPIPIYLKTSLDIAAAIDPSDRDPIVVEPNAAQAKILEAIHNLGFRVFKSDLEFGRIDGHRLPFYQEIEFYPPAHLSTYMSELELTFVPRDNEMDVILEIDKKTRGFERLMYSSIDEVRGFTMAYNAIYDYNWEEIIESQLEF